MCRGRRHTDATSAVEMPPAIVRLAQAVNGRKIKPSVSEFNTHKIPCSNKGDFVVSNCFIDSVQEW